jgi:hypothetical protein
MSDRAELLLLCAASLLCLLLGATAVERAGRRGLYLGCAVASSLACAALAVCFAVEQLEPGIVLSQ